MYIWIKYTAVSSKIIVKVCLLINEEGATFINENQNTKNLNKI